MWGRPIFRFISLGDLFQKPNYARNSCSNLFLKHVFYRGQATESPAIAPLRVCNMTFLLISLSGAFAGLFVYVLILLAGENDRNPTRKRGT